MLSKVREKTMHSVRWVLVIGWLILIASLFYDPISQYLTDPNNLISPFRDANECVLVQGKCLDVNLPYPMGTRIFWGMVVPSAIMLVLVFGHETWRRICPLYFLSQIPRALGLQPKLNEKNSCLTNNHLYIQFAFFFVGLNARILFINSARPVLGLFLLLTIFLAITMVYLYGGRSWCHYICPFSIVQMVFTGPRGLLGSEAHKARPKSITQSMCRSIDQTTSQEKSACINCKSPCLDIDAERTYWESLTKPGRKLVQYGYLGLVISYFIYYFLYSGNFDYYYSGDWTHETNQLTSLFNPGFYILTNAIPIPKIIAAPVTLTFGVVITYVICSQIEKAYKAYLRKKISTITQPEVLHRVFSICTFISFNTFFIYGGRPEIIRFPAPVQLTFNALVILVSTLWLYRTWGRTSEQYTRESLADKLRRQLKKLTLDFSQFLEARSLDDLKPDEVYLLAKVLPHATHQDRLQVYKGVLKEALEAGNTNASSSLELLQQLRHKLGMNEAEHYTVLTELGIENPDLLDPNQQRTRENKLRISSYRQALDLLLLELVESGMSLEQAFQRKSQQFRALKREYRITSEEDAQVLAGMFHQNSDLRRKAETLLVQLQVLVSRYQVLNNLVPNPEATVFVLLRSFILQPQQKLITSQLLGILEIIGEHPDAFQLAQRTGILARNVLPEMLTDEINSWQQRLSPKIITVLIPSPNVPIFPKTMVQKSPDDQTIVGSNTGQKKAVINVLNELLQEANPLTQAASLYAIYQMDNQTGKPQATRLLSHPKLDNLVIDTAKNILEQSEKLTTLEKLLRLFEIDCFKCLKQEVLISLAQMAKIRTYRREEVLCNLEKCPNEILILIAGEAQIQITRNHLIYPVGKVYSGQIIAQLRGLSPTLDSATVVAATSGVQALEIPASYFENLLHHYPLLAKYL